MRNAENEDLESAFSSDFAKKNGLSYWNMDRWSRQEPTISQQIWRLSEGFFG
jgi:hypothetical protein